MKKLFLIFVFALIFTIAQAQPVPELYHVRTGQSDPAFVLVKLPTAGIDAGDWVGVCDVGSGLCYGAKQVTDPTKNTYIVCFGDEALTEKKDGFSYGATMTPFYWEKDNSKCYEVTGTWINEMNGRTVELKWYPIGVYNVQNFAIGNEISLATDPDLVTQANAPPQTPEPLPQNLTFYDDQNVIIFQKGDEIWVKVKAEKISLQLYRNDNGTERKSFTLSSKTAGYEQRIFSNYTRSWKGQTFRMTYYYYAGGKMVSKTPTEKHFTL